MLIINPFVRRFQKRLLPLAKPPQSLCILRLSAIGDVCHTVAIIRTLQAFWPLCNLTWIIGKTEAKLVGDLPGIRFFIFDKNAGYAAFRDLWRKLRGKRFDILFHMQTSIRANLISVLIPADIRLGFDRPRAKDYQWLFSTHRIKSKTQQHVLDSFFGFLETVGIKARHLEWDLPIPSDATDFAEKALPGAQKTLVISPCANPRFRNLRNWTSEGYAAVCDYAATRFHMRVVLTGGSTPTEAHYGSTISAKTQCPVLNLIGKTNLKEVLAVLKKATVLIAPDSGPAHMATAVGTPVIGLYATTNPQRARPYFSEAWVVNQYPKAVETFLGKNAEDLPWGTRVRHPRAMTLIRTEDVIAKLDALMQTLGKAGLSS